MSSTSKPSLSRLKPLIAAIMLAALAAGGWWFSTHRGQPSKPPAAQAAPMSSGHGDTMSFPEHAPQLTMLKVVPVQMGASPLAEPLAARLVYDEDLTARIGTSFAGRIVALKAAAGDRVKAGQTLAEIDSPDFGSANADLNKALADLDQKRRALARSKELLQAEVIARKDFELAAADEAQARAEAERAQLRVRNLLPSGAKVTGERLPLSSPISGVVTERNANPAMEVNPSLTAPLFVVTDPRKLWLQIDLPEHLLSKVQVGASVDIQVEAWPGEKFVGRVVQVGQVIDPSTRRIPVRAEVDNAALKLRPEMFARAVLTRQSVPPSVDGASAPASGGAVEVPNTAIVNDGLYAAVFVETAPREFSKRRVEIAIRGAETSFLSSGVKDGERIVAQGALLLAAEMHSGADEAQPPASGTLPSGAQK